MGEEKRHRLDEIGEKNFQFWGKKKKIRKDEVQSEGSRKVHFDSKLRGALLTRIGRSQYDMGKAAGH